MAALPPIQLMHNRECDQLGRLATEATAIVSASAVKQLLGVPIVNIHLAVSNGSRRRSHRRDSSSSRCLLHTLGSFPALSPECSVCVDGVRVTVAGRFLVIIGLVAAVSAALTASAHGARAQGLRIISADEFVRRIQAGETIDERDVIISGDVDLGPVGTVTRPIRCLNCDFQGEFDAPDVVFDRIVVLSGAHFFGQIDLRGAEFKDRFIVRRSDRTSVFEKFSLFSFATFDDTANFDESTFKVEGNFTSARFLGDASFAETRFLIHARFNQTAFGRQALFTSSSESGQPSSSGPCGAPVKGTISGQAVFTRTVFVGVADFRQRCFARLADFRSATFESRANFSLARFAAGARFDDTGFQGEAQFLATRFRQPVSFARASASRSLDFEDAVFDRVATFQGLAVSGSLSFDNAAFRGQIGLERLIAGGLQMNVSAVGRVAGSDTQARILALIEASDRDRGDLRSANDARYKLLSLENRRSSRNAAAGGSSVAPVTSPLGKGRSTRGTSAAQAPIEPQAPPHPPFHRAMAERVLRGAGRHGERGLPTQAAGAPRGPRAGRPLPSCRARLVRVPAVQGAIRLVPAGPGKF